LQEFGKLLEEVEEDLRADINKAKAEDQKLIDDTNGLIAKGSK